MIRSLHLILKPVEEEEHSGPVNNLENPVWLHCEDGMSVMRQEAGGQAGGYCSCLR